MLIFSSWGFSLKTGQGRATRVVSLLAPAENVAIFIPERSEGLLFHQASDFHRM